MKKVIVLLCASLLSLSFALTGMAAEKKTEPVARQQQLDINTASEAELRAFAGIGEAYSRKIIAGRPYTKTDQLVSKKILSKAEYEQIKGKIIASKIKKEEQSLGYP